jgi:surfactin synthase thioesterase subunit
VPNELIGHSYDVRVSFETNKPSEGKWLSPQALIALGDKAFKKITRIEVKRHGNGESHWEDAKNRLKKRRFYN